jgi:hypothetical protein
MPNEQLFIQMSNLKLIFATIVGWPILPVNWRICAVFYARNFLQNSKYFKYFPLYFNRKLIVVCYIPQIYEIIIRTLLTKKNPKISASVLFLRFPKVIFWIIVCFFLIITGLCTRWKQVKNTIVALYLWKKIPQMCWSGRVCWNLALKRYNRVSGISYGKWKVDSYSIKVELV